MAGKQKALYTFTAVFRRPNYFEHLGAGTVSDSPQSPPAPTGRPGLRQL